MSIIYSVRENCSGCYACVRNCPVKAIRIRDGLAEVVKERCIDCGNCIDVCVAKAKVAESDVEKVWQLLNNTTETIAVISTAFPAAFLDCTSGQLVAALKKLGFSEVMEDSFAAELVGVEYAHYLQESHVKPAISSNCPAVVTYIRKYHPSLVNNIVPVVSPMIATGRIIKKIHNPEASVVFISPCVTKKTESLDPDVAGVIDGVITFTELKSMMDTRRIFPDQMPEEDFDGPSSQIGRLFSISDGLLRVIGLEDNVLNNDVISVHGRDYVVKITDEFAKGEITSDFADIYFCHGCIGGPSINNDLSTPRRKELVARHARSKNISKLTPGDLNRYSEINLRRHFTSSQLTPLPHDEQEVFKIALALGGTDCGACGYSSCRDLAESICTGMAEIEMCWPYVLRQLKTTQQGLIRTEKLSSLGQMAASIAHEVNNPLAGVLTYTQLLEKKIAGGKYDEETAQEYLSKMETELIRSTKLIRSLLDFARQSPPSMRPVSINDVITKSLEIASHSAKLQHIEVRQELASQLPEIMADFDQLQQVFINLIINAIQAMPDSGTLKLTTWLENNLIYAEVKDTGCGISEENMYSLFTPFFTTKDANKGVGLGLAVAHGLIENHKGRINVESTEGEGTTFTVILPVKNE